ncbi:unnamed protein product [Leptosia nina]|uniref:Uncharacterized protein n=1 Tax=Leptosia nina TaxID=320188 RepID=A0AAV1K2Q7_9NEOP
MREHIPIENSPSMRAAEASGVIQMTISPRLGYCISGFLLEKRKELAAVDRCLSICGNKPSPAALSRCETT